MIKHVTLSRAVSKLAASAASDYITGVTLPQDGAVSHGKQVGGKDAASDYITGATLPADGGYLVR